MRVTPTDVYDKDGNLTKIEMYDGNGEFVIQFLWDEHDEQTSANREAFRKWAYRHINQNTDYEVDL